MPNSVREIDLEEICAQCKQSHGNSITLERFNHKVYEVINCQNCGYEIIRLQQEKFSMDKLDAVNIR